MSEKSSTSPECSIASVIASCSATLIPRMTIAMIKAEI
jgi:hypothetical protein